MGKRILNKCIGFLMTAVLFDEVSFTVPQPNKNGYPPVCYAG